MKRLFFLITLVIFFAGLILPLFSLAADPVQFCGQVTIPIPGFDLFTKGKCSPVSGETIALTVAGIYKFVVGLSGIAAVIVMMAGGYLWLFAGGNTSKVGEAKSMIGSAVLGLFLALGSFMILNLINPKLTQPQPINPKKPTVLEMGKVKRICSSEEREKALKEAGTNAALFQCGSIYYPHYSKYTECLEKAKVDKDLKCNPNTLGAFDNGCIDIYCPEKTLTLKNQACMIEANEDGFLVGGRCDTEMYLESQTTKQKKKFSIDNAFLDGLRGVGCGSVSEGGSDEVYNDCNDKGTCAVISLKGTTPIIGDNITGYKPNGTPIVTDYYVNGVYLKGELIKMACRDELMSKIK